MGVFRACLLATVAALAIASPAAGDVTITFPDAEKSELWDLRIEDEKENAITWTGLKLNEISEVTLHWDGKKAWADVK